MVQALGEVAIIKVKKGTKPVQPDIKVYKCPYRNCDFEAFNYDDVSIHRINQHADVPKFFTNDLGSGGKAGFSKEKLRKQSNYMLKFQMQIIGTRVKLFMNAWEARQKKNKERATVRKNAYLAKKYAANPKTDETDIIKV